MTSVVLRAEGENRERLAPLRVTVPESWLEKGCAKLAALWRKKHGARKVTLCAEDGTPIPNEWPIEAVLALYGDALWVRDCAADDVLEAANDLYRSGEYRSAIDAYSKALKRARSAEARRMAWSNRAAAHAMLGHDADAANDCDAALADWHEAIDAEDEQQHQRRRRDRVRLRCARCRLRLGDWDAALRRYEEVLRDGAAACGCAAEEAMAEATEASRGAEQARALGVALRGAKRGLEKGLFQDDRVALRAAFLAASKAARAAPASSEAKALEFRCLCALKAWPAAALFSEIDGVIEDDRRVDRQLADCVLRAAAYGGDEAVIAKSLDRWSAQCPASRAWLEDQRSKWRDVFSLKARGDAALSEGGDAAAAAEAYRSALRLDASFPALHANLAAALQAAGHFDAASQVCLDATWAQPLYPTARLRRARCLAAASRTDDAADEYARYFRDCRATGTDPAPTARAELDRLNQAPHEDVRSDDDERHFFEQYRAYAQRFARQRRAEAEKPAAADTSTTERASAFAALGLSASASPADLKRRYRDLVLKFHPDKSSDPDAEDKFRRIHAAYHSIVQQ